VIVPFHKLRGSAYPLLNLLLFKLSWLLLVVGQQAGLLWALALQAVSLCLHPSLRTALRPTLLVGLSGIGIDMLCYRSGLFVFPQQQFPAWLLVLWLTFAFALPQGLGFLRRLPLPAVAGIGLLLGPLSYGIGERLGAVQFGLSLFATLMILGAIWAVFLPLALQAPQWRLRPAAFCMLLIPGLLSSPDAMAAPAASDTPQYLIGKASLSWFFRPIYEASLYAETPQFHFPSDTAFTLALDYRLDLRREQIVKETLRQWDRQRLRIDPRWESLLGTLVPDIRAGDRLALQVDANLRAQLLHNGSILGPIEDPDFVTAFAGIWLAESTTRPELRQQLLGLP
jgi:hypothetical protein